MKKLVLTLALVFGVLAANAQYFVGGQFGLLYDDASENTMITIAPEFGYAFNDTWTVAGMIGYTPVSYTHLTLPTSDLVLYRSVCPLEFLEERFCRLIGRWWFRYFYSKV